MNVKITKLKVLLTDGADEIYGEMGELDAPILYLPHIKAVFKMLTSQGTGVGYCQSNFPGVPIEVANIAGKG